MDRIKESFEKMKNNLANASIDDAAAFIEDKHHSNYQSLVSLALNNKKLTPDEANTVFYRLGQTPKDFNKQELHIRMVLLSLYNELLHLRHKATTPSIQ